MDFETLARRQHGVVSRAQALEHLSTGAVSWRLASKRWRVVHPGILATHTAELTWFARAQSALLHAGVGSALGVASAAYLLGLQDTPPAIITVLIPESRRVRKVPGVRIVRRRHMKVVHRRGMQVTSAAATTIDLAGVPGTLVDEAVAHLATAVRKRKASVAELVDELQGRRRHPHRAVLNIALGIIDRGAQSVLEVKFHDRVLRRHGLPAMAMQSIAEVDGHSIRRDFEHLETSTIVEVDGRLGHEGAGRRRDYRRDRRAASRGSVTLRADWVDVDADPCGLAADIFGTLSTRGYQGGARPCGPACTLGLRYARAR